MRFAVLSDIHGNLPALEAVFKDLEPFSLDGIIVAGDYIGGPQPNETIRLLRSMKGWMIRGNSDDNLIRYSKGKASDSWRDSKQWALTRWTYRKLDVEILVFLKSLPQQRVVKIGNTSPIRVVHGSHRDPSESIYPVDDPGLIKIVFSEVKEPVFICGHTHISWAIEQPGRLALNPGAVCGPLNGYVGAEYALLSWENYQWNAELRKVPYDIERVRMAFQNSGLLEEGGALAKAFLRSIETGSNIAEDFLSYAYKRAEAAGFKGCEVVPDSVWDAAAETFDWKIMR
jgi:putative phosphoesterase